MPMPTSKSYENFSNPFNYINNRTNTTSPTSLGISFPQSTQLTPIATAACTAIESIGNQYQQQHQNPLLTLTKNHSFDSHCSLFDYSLHTYLNPYSTDMEHQFVEEYFIKKLPKLFQEWKCIQLQLKQCLKNRLKEDPNLLKKDIIDDFFKDKELEEKLDCITYQIKLLSVDILEEFDCDSFEVKIESGSFVDWLKVLEKEEPSFKEHLPEVLTNFSSFISHYFELPAIKYRNECFDFTGNPMNGVFTGKLLLEFVKSDKAFNKAALFAVNHSHSESYEMQFLVIEILARLMDNNQMLPLVIKSIINLSDSENKQVQSFIGEIIASILEKRKNKEITLKVSDINKLFSLAYSSNKKVQKQVIGFIEELLNDRSNKNITYQQVMPFIQAFSCSEESFIKRKVASILFYGLKENELNLGEYGLNSDLLSITKVIANCIENKNGNIGRFLVGLLKRPLNNYFLEKKILEYIKVFTSVEHSEYHFYVMGLLEVLVEKNMYMKEVGESLWQLLWSETVSVQKNARGMLDKLSQDEEVKEIIHESMMPGLEEAKRESPSFTPMDLDSVIGSFNESMSDFMLI